MENSKENIIKEIEKMYDLYAEGILNYLISILKSTYDAEDVLQNLFLKIAKYGDKIYSIKNLKNYLFSSARNEAITYIKSRKNFETIDDKLSFLETKDEKPDSILETQQVEKYLIELPLEQREVIILKVYNDFSFDEIAKILKISINTAASRYRYAIEKLRVLFNNYSSERSLDRS